LDGIKKTPVLKREELYQGLIEPGWGAGLLNPLGSYFPPLAAMLKIFSLLIPRPLVAG
jgi:hypothetical protein